MCSDSDPHGWFDSNNSLENIIEDMKLFLCSLLSDNASVTLTEHYREDSDPDPENHPIYQTASESRSRRVRYMLILTISAAATQADTIAIQLIFCYEISIRQMIAFFDFDLVRSSLEFDVFAKTFNHIDIYGVREDRDNLGFRGIDQLAMTQDAYLDGPRHSNFRFRKYDDRSFSIETYEQIFCPSLWQPDFKY